MGLVTHRAFTLLELLVVVSIIGLLASVTLSGLASARAKARNAYTLQMIRQYEVALEMYANDNNGRYPFEDVNMGGVICLGGQVNAADGCFGAAKSNAVGTPNEQRAEQIRTALTRYIPSYPSVHSASLNIPVFGGLQSGAIYRSCAGYLSCMGNQKIIVRWFLIGTNQACGPGVVLNANNNGNTLCEWNR